MSGAPATRTLNPDDPIDLAAMLSDQEIAVRDSVRAFSAKRILPEIGEWYERGEIPTADLRVLMRDLGELGVLGMHLTGHGCAGMSAVEYGLACLELEAVDSGLRSLVSVQGSLAMFAIWKHGSDEHKQRWLPAMAAGEAIGCFGLTEPDAGSDPASMRTTARRDGADWVLTGRKMWITNGSVADVAIVWARTDDEPAGPAAGDAIRGFVVPTGTPGFEAPLIKRKASLRASVTSELVLDEVRLPASAMLPGARGLGGPLSCLNEARYGILWGVMGAAAACHRAALEYAGTRVQFDSPIAAFQLTQAKLADMTVELAKGILLALHLGRLKDTGRLRPGQVSLGKLTNVREALEICRTGADDPGSERHLVRISGHAAHGQPGVRAHLRRHQRNAHARPRPGTDRTFCVPAMRSAAGR